MESAEIFDKKFEFNHPKDGWRLPSANKLYTNSNWKINQFQELKIELNSVKSELNDYVLEDWHKHTNATNPAGTVILRVKQEVRPELLTQAWCKMYEILSNYPVISKLATEFGTMNSLHLCEAPGAFITALNHFLKLNHPGLKWDWIATTLNPYHEENAPGVMINDDRFLLRSIMKWNFGVDKTGDIMNSENMLALVQECVNLGPVLLITADGSIDCQNNPSHQEELVAPLLFCETVTALRILSAGGTFILKIFTMFENQTICLLYLLCSLFQSVHIFKPATSKEGNSECYVVCINYAGVDDCRAYLRELLIYYGSSLPTCAMFPLLEIPEDFIEQLLQCSKQFKIYQENALKRNINLFKFDAKVVAMSCKETKQNVAYNFIRKLKLVPINRSDELIGRDKITQTLTCQKDKEKGSFNAKLKRENLSPKVKLKFLLDEISKINCGRSDGFKDVWLEFNDDVSTEIITGKPVNTVRSSKFCSAYLLNLQYQQEVLLRTLNERIHRVDVLCLESMSSAVQTAISKSCPSLLQSKYHVINFQNLLWPCVSSGAYHTLELSATEKILKTINKTCRNVSVVLEGYPLLTQLSTGVVYMLSHFFRQVLIVQLQERAGVIIFVEFRSKNHSMRGMRQLLSTMKYPEDGNNSIISIFPIEKLLENQRFFKTVVLYNETSLKAQMTKSILDVLDQ